MKSKSSGDAQKNIKLNAGNSAEQNIKSMPAIKDKPVDPTPTIADALREVSDQLDCLYGECESQQEAMPANLQRSSAYYEVGEQAEAYRRLGEFLDCIVDSLDDNDVDNGNGSSEKIYLSNIPFYPPRFITGSRPKRTGRLIEIIEAVAATVERLNYETAQSLYVLGTELERI